MVSRLKIEQSPYSVTHFQHLFCSMFNNLLFEYFNFRLRADSIVGNRRRLARIQRSNSSSNIAARLGVRRNSGVGAPNRLPANANGPRRKLNRSNSFSNTQRNNSRARSLSRSNSNTNLTRSTSRSSIRRANSRNRNSINRQLTVLQQQQQFLLQQRQRLSTGRNLRRRMGNIAAPQQRKRSNSVNARLGGNRTNAVLKRGGGRIQGRIGVKPILRGRVFRNSTGPPNNNGQQPNQTRSRSRSRTR